MTSPMRHEYKGYTIELTPQGNYCSAFAVDVRDASGRVVSHLGSGGNFAERAVERGKELIDFEEALHQPE